MSDVFISYASEDRERIEPIAKLLESQGWSVWWDRRIPVGGEFDTTIETAMREARCVLVAWSHASVDSRWVRAEAGEGAERGVLAPALLDAVEPPLEFRRLQAASLVGWDGAAAHPESLRLLKSIAGILGAAEPDAAEGSYLDGKLSDLRMALLTRSSSRELRHLRYEAEQLLKMHPGHPEVRSLIDRIEEAVPPPPPVSSPVPPPSALPGSPSRRPLAALRVLLLVIGLVAIVSILYLWLRS